jgi:TolB-like protein
MKKLAVIFIGICISVCLAEGPLKIAVMDLKARSGIDNMVVLSLTDLVCTELSGYEEFEVIARDDMQAMLEHIADQQLLECDDIQCLAEVGGALGVAQLMSGNIGKVGDVYLINLKLIDIEKAEVLNRFSKEFKGNESGLITYMKHAVAVLLGKPGLDEETLKELEQEAVKGPAMAQPEMMTLKRPRQGTQMVKRFIRYTMITAGVVSAALSAYMYMESNRIYNEKYIAIKEPDRVWEIEAARQKIEDLDLKTNILLGASGVCFLGGVITFVF